MTPSKYIIKPLANRKIHSFYYNVAKKYKHTYDFDDFARVFLYNQIYADFFGTPGAFDDRLMTIRSKDVVFLGSSFESTLAGSDGRQSTKLTLNLEKGEDKTEG